MDEAGKSDMGNVARRAEDAFKVPDSFGPASSGVLVRLEGGDFQGAG